MIIDANAPKWPKWMRRLILLVALTAGGCIVNPVPTPGSSDESPTAQPIDGKTNDSLAGGGAADAGASQNGDDIAADGPGDVTPTDAPSAADGSVAAD